MRDETRPWSIVILSAVMCLFGLMMLGYWALYIRQGMPLEHIPLASEILTALAAMVAAYGLYKLKRWGLVASLVVAGMWIYAVVNGIFLLLAEGFAVASPIGAMTDLIAFVLTLIFSLLLIGYLGKRQTLFR